MERSLDLSTNCVGCLPDRVQNNTTKSTPKRSSQTSSLVDLPISDRLLGLFFSIIQLINPMCDWQVLSLIEANSLSTCSIAVVDGASRTEGGPPASLRGSIVARVLGNCNQVSFDRVLSHQTIPERYQSSDYQSFTFPEDTATIVTSTPAGMHASLKTSSSTHIAGGLSIQFSFCR